MIDVSSKLYLCYAWEDIARVQNVLKELEDELQAKLSSDLDSKYNSDFDDLASKKIEDAEIFVVFISESSKKSDFVKTCVVRAKNLNKNILPIEIDKSNLFSSAPEEFKFRSKPYSFLDKDSKAMLFAQLKASLGFNVESGDGFGALIHIVTDRDAHVFRYGEDLGLATAGVDFKIRLKKGTHLLDFIDEEDSSLKYSLSYIVESNDNEQFLNVPLCKLLREKQQKEEKALREEEMKRKFDEENYQKNLELEQKKRESEAQRQIQENQQIAQRRYEESQRKVQNEKKSGPGCITLWLIIVLGIAFPLTLFFSLPYLYFAYKKK